MGLYLFLQPPPKHGKVGFNSWRRSLSCRYQSIGLHSKSLNWFLHDRDVRHKKVKGSKKKSHCKLTLLVVFMSITLAVRKIHKSETYLGSWTFMMERFSENNGKQFLLIISLIFPVTRVGLKLEVLEYFSYWNKNSCFKFFFLFSNFQAMKVSKTF